jgi:hypothetical protein
MRMIRMIGLLVAMTLASTWVLTPAFACPKGYIACGGACCPTR